jgi:hypothetical protein
MYQIVLFDKDGKVLKEENHYCVKTAIMSLMRAEENLDYDHGYVVNCDTGEIFESFGFVSSDGGVTSPSDEVILNPFHSCYYNFVN